MRQNTKRCRNDGGPADALNTSQYVYGDLALSKPCAKGKNTHYGGSRQEDMLAAVEVRYPPEKKQKASLFITEAESVNDIVIKATG